jgi:dienelactone hydrolase/predicted Ser/Thr protein kinase
LEERIVSHYRVVDRLGGGGMGVVYKAIDERLDRTVALKFLPPDLTRDDDARRRLIQEAKTASALDHSNICTIYDIDSAPDGQLFIAMTFYDGQTLKKRIAEGPLPIEQTIDYSTQIAQGLAKAHDAGIVHRDIKPANLIVTRDGVIKIVDFGIAKLTGDNSATRTGAIFGTATYMSPEQIDGLAIDARTDVWSLGVVIYEMLAGRPPFEQERPLALMKEIATQPHGPLRSVRSDVPEGLSRVVDRALRKNRDERYASVGDLVRDLTACRSALGAPAPPAQTTWGSLNRPRVVAAAVVLLALIGGASAWAVNRSAKTRWARQQLGEIGRLADQDKYGAAFVLAEQVEPYLAGDAELRDLWPRVSREIAVTTNPPGARVYTKDYAETADRWVDLGETPLKNVRVPMGLRRWKFVKEGLATRELARTIGGPNGNIQDVVLTNDADPSTVFVSGGRGGNSWITGIDPIESVSVTDYFIDRYEITNRQFKAFADAGGYRKRDLWDQPFVADGRTIAFEDAIARFVDLTGRPGPATWRLGEYAAGQEDYPVGGVSWYEAAAFAKFSGKSLPTVTHWIRAAGTTIAASIEPLSNLQGSGPTAVGKFTGMSPFGAFDMAGNVREWCWNAWGNSRYILGGAWPDQQYLFTYANVQSPFDRSPINGIRLARYKDGMPPAAAQPVELLVRDYAKEKPVNDEVFNAYRAQFQYDSTPLNAVVENVPNVAKGAHIEKVSFEAAYGRSRTMAYISLPRHGTPPYQAVVVFPGSSAINTPSVMASGILELSDMFVKSGRAVVVPVYRGSFERREDLSSTWPDRSDRYREMAVSWVRDAKRTIDYLETRKDIDAGRLAYYGVSWGGRMGAIVPAVESRLKAVILDSGGLASGRARPEIDQLNYVSRVTQPVLMLNGRFDAIEPVEAAQRPLFEALGAAKDHKKWVVYDDDHVEPAHRNEVAREALAWLDRYLGPVK